MKKIQKTDQEWRDILSDEEYSVLRKGSTEAASSGKYYHFDDKGLYLCAACGNALFDSTHKYNSGSGWPSFDAPNSTDAVIERSDDSHNMKRTEVICARCDSHLGHVFNDGPKTTGLRYCINSAALKFNEKE